MIGRLTKRRRRPIPGESRVRPKPRPPESGIKARGRVEDAQRYMKLTVLLPFQIFVEENDVARIVARLPTVRSDSCRAGSIAWRRWPGILIYETETAAKSASRLTRVLIKAGRRARFRAQRHSRYGPWPIAGAVEREFYP